MCVNGVDTNWANMAKSVVLLGHAASELSELSRAPHMVLSSGIRSEGVSFREERGVWKLNDIFTELFYSGCKHLHYGTLIVFILTLGLSGFATASSARALIGLDEAAALSTGRRNIRRITDMMTRTERHSYTPQTARIHLVS